MVFREARWMKVSEFLVEVNGDIGLYNVLYAIDVLSLEVYDNKKQEFEREKKDETLSLFSYR